MLHVNQDIDDFPVPVGYWKFGEGSGAIAKDSSPEGNDGTIHGASWVNGWLGPGLSFDDLNDCVTVPDDDSLDITQELTLIASIKRSRIDHWHGILAKDNGVWNETAYTILFTNGNKLEVRTSKTGAYTSVAKNLTVTTEKYTDTEDWLRIAATYKYVTDGTSEGKIYVNAIEKASNSTLEGPILVNAYPLRIGLYGLSYYTGAIVDEVLVYNAVFNARQVLEDFYRFS